MNTLIQEDQLLDLKAELSELKRKGIMSSKAYYHYSASRGRWICVDPRFN